MSMPLNANVSLLVVLMLITSLMKFINVSGLVYEYLIHWQSACPIDGYLDDIVSNLEQIFWLWNKNFHCFIKSLGLYLVCVRFVSKVIFLLYLKCSMAYQDKQRHFNRILNDIQCKRGNIHLFTLKHIWHDA